MSAELERSTGVTNPLVLLQAAIDKGMDPDRLGKLMDLSERWERNQAANAYAVAMNAAQAEMPSVVRDAQNDHTKSLYARLETVNAVVKPIYTKHGFSLSYGETDSPKEGHCRVTVDVRHVGGHCEQYHGDFPLDGSGIKGNQMMTPIHGKGSTFSYARRYLVLLVFNVAMANEDNDAAGALDTILKHEQDTLNQLIEEKGVDLARFLAWAKIEKVEDMLRKDFSKATDMLQRKQRKAVPA